MEKKLKNSEAYLTSLFKKENGFSVPKNYFEDTEARLQSFLSEDKIPKKKTFSTPEFYFDNLEDEIITKVTSKERKPRVFSLMQKKYKLATIGIAASIILSIGIGYFNDFTSEVNFENLSQNDIESWILENSSEITSQEIANYIPFESKNTTDFILANINDQEIEEYIIYNDSSILLNEIN